MRDALLGAGVAAQKMQINGAGATFPYPIYSKWFSEYNKLHPDVEINYQSIGSGGGIRQITNQTVFFGATDGPMTERPAPGRAGQDPALPDRARRASCRSTTCPGVTAQLKFTRPAPGRHLPRQDHASGTTRPSRRSIRASTLPSTNIAVVHRSDGSGTTYIWVDYLSKVSPEWKKKVGVATSVNWPVGLGGPGNEGVAGLVKQTPGALGYVELIYALQNNIAYGVVQNMDGEFVKASLQSVTAAAAAAAAKMPADFRVSITNAPGKDVYPISSFTWMLFYESPRNKAKAKTMVDFMKWALTDGQKFARISATRRCRPPVVKLEMEALKKIKVQ